MATFRAAPNAVWANAARAKARAGDLFWDNAMTQATVTIPAPLPATILRANNPAKPVTSRQARFAPSTITVPAWATVDKANRPAGRAQAALAIVVAPRSAAASKP